MDSLKQKATVIIIIIMVIVSCKDIAIFSAQSKKASSKQTDLQIKANKYFWEQFHAGNYDSIPHILHLLTAAYLENPNDFESTQHLAFTHMWALSERTQDSIISPRITEHIILAKKYFKEAWLLGDKKDARIHGFLASAMIAEGKVDNDDKKVVDGYFEMKKAIKEFPEFNYFTAGYVMSQLPKDNKRFAEGVEWQWKNLDVCACKKVDRKNPHYSQFMNLETYEGTKRVCWNSWIAPHNFEGFFLNMGDMLVKQGDWETAIKIYESAKLSKTYDKWAYSAVLEERIANAHENTDYFKRSDMKDDRRIMMVNTAFACMACHRE